MKATTDALHLRIEVDSPRATSSDSSGNMSDTGDEKLAGVPESEVEAKLNETIRVPSPSR